MYYYLGAKPHPEGLNSHYGAAHLELICMKTVLFEILEKTKREFLPILNQPRPLITTYGEDPRITVFAEMYSKNVDRLLDSRTVSIPCQMKMRTIVERFTILLHESRWPEIVDYIFAEAFENEEYDVRFNVPDDYAFWPLYLFDIGRRKISRLYYLDTSKVKDIKNFYVSAGDSPPGMLYMPEGIIFLPYDKNACKKPARKGEIKIYNGSKELDDEVCIYKYASLFVYCHF